MKEKFKYLLSVVALAMFLVCCVDGGDEDIITPDPDPDPKPPVELTDNEYTNYWIYDKMKRVYLWNDKLPASPNYKSDPEKFFESILFDYKKVTGDRFSWIEPDLSKTKSSSEVHIGFKVVTSPYFLDENAQNSSLGLFVVSVQKGSDAEAKGLKRGNIIYAVDGTEVTSNNYRTILNKASFQLSVYNSEGEKVTLQTINSSSTEYSPLFMSKIIQEGGKKIAYVKYDEFTRGLNNSTANFDYDKELISSISGLQNYDEFILDLRYNPGGYLSSAMALASIILPNRDGKIFAKEQYNPYFEDSLVNIYGKNGLNDYFINNLKNIGGPNVDIPKSNLSRVFILANNFSASASELVIHGLKPHMAVIHIGETTVGKDKASINVNTDDKRIKWQLQPLVSRLTNANGEGNYIYGITPEPANEVLEWEECYAQQNAYYIDDNGNRVDVKVPLASPWGGGFKEYGDPSDPLIAEAIAQITGVPRIKSVKSASDGKIRKIPHLKQDESQYKTILDENRFERLDKK